MFAVVKTGGKQYKVSEGDVIQVEKLAGEVGTAITLDQVLMVGEDEDVQVGSPMLDGNQVTAEITEQLKDKKIIVFKKKRLKNNIATLAAVAAVGTAFGNIFFASETTTPVAAVARLHGDFYLVDEHGCGGESLKKIDSSWKRGKR